jgi:iron complex outermembrane receptor protein
VPVLPADSPYSSVTPTAVVGQPLALSPKNRVTLSATYKVPLDQSIGSISLGANYVHTDSQIFTQTTLPQFVRLPATDLVNLNVNWDGAVGLPVDVSFFLTNLTNQKYPVSIGGNYTSNGFETAIYGQPRMWGFRLRYNFGS